RLGKARFSGEVVKATQHQRDLRFTGQTAPRGRGIPVRIVTSAQHACPLIQVHERPHPCYRCCDELFSVQQLADAEQSFEHVTDGVQKRSLVIRKCISVEPCVFALLAEYPITVFSSGFDELVFAELDSCERESPRGSRV